MLLWVLVPLLSLLSRRIQDAPTFHLGCTSNPQISQTQIPILFGPVPLGQLPLTLGLSTRGGPAFLVPVLTLQP